MILKRNLSTKERERCEQVETVVRGSIYDTVPPFRGRSHQMSSICIAMLIIMSIVRQVNGFVDEHHLETKRNNAIKTKRATLTR